MSSIIRRRMVSLRTFSSPAPLLDFLAPNFIRTATITTSAAARSQEANTSSTKPKPSTKPRNALTEAQQKYLERAIRVNQAGELAAVLIYAAQTPLVTRSHPYLRPLMKHMYDQEVGHFTTFNALLTKHRIRPTYMWPLWRVAASFLGWSTAALGREAAMACTEAVETTIGEHYNGQVRNLLAIMKDIEDKGEDVGEEFRQLLKDLKRIRDEEVEHLDHAIEEHAREAPAYPLLSTVIQNGCKGAIWLSERT
ncbi:MAG: hypothetical protein M1834_007942 [Cirrosporium novae-zelandiae]|nr:MAG: hypothetical protein M1834_007942 [Cirrosporium novae-zelandiae]